MKYNPCEETIMKHYDIAFVSAGSEGLAAVQIAQRHGLRAALLEKNKIGGHVPLGGFFPPWEIHRRCGCRCSRASVKLRQSMLPTSSPYPVPWMPGNSLDHGCPID
jgi:hypothetical protein